MNTGAAARLADTGWLESVDLLDEEARLALRDLEVPVAGAMTWDKGLATVSPTVHRVATNPRLVAMLQELLGPELMLWGARLIRQAPGERHRWHIDAETVLAGGPTVDVWVAVDNVGPASTLRLVPGSQHLVPSIKERLLEVGRRDVDDAQVVAWATADLPGAEVQVPEVHDGQAVVFDGRVWHATSNEGDRERISLLLQYAAPSTAIWIPRSYDLWPPEPRQDVRAPCLLVRGSAAPEANRFVPPPDAASVAAVWTHQIPVPVPGTPTGPRLHREIFEGPVASVAYLEAHASTLLDGQTPHPPHHHPHEELLIVLDGDPELVLVEDGQERIVPTTRGTVGWYPLGPLHTLRAVNGDATYVMFRFYSGEAGHAEGTALLSLTTVNALDVLADAPDRRDGRGGQPTLFEGPTTYLRRLQGHATLLRPGEGYPGHADDYDIIVVVLSGEVTTNDGEVVGPDGVIFWPAGLPHEARNEGDVDARYVVFELHPGAERQPHVPMLRRFGRWLLPTSVKKFLKERLPIPDRPRSPTSR